MYITFFIFALLVQECLTSNWAQTSGDMAQNVVFPAIPSPYLKHWEARFGHATVVAQDVSALFHGSLYTLILPNALEIVYSKYF